MGREVFVYKAGTEQVKRFEVMPDFRFDQWTNLYASRVSNMRSSEIREMMAVTGRPDIISFAGGLPDTRCFPVNQIVEATQRVMLREGAAALQYGASEGYEALRRHIVDIMAEINVELGVDDLIITDGAQQALEFLGKIFISKGDSIIVEGPSYVGALQAFSGFEPNVIAIPLDDSGMRVDILADRLKELAVRGIQPKFLYTVPNFHNPAGFTLSAERRKEIIELSMKYGFIIIEDDPYGRLRYDGVEQPSLKSMYENVIYLGTFSKIFAPGMRLGWVAAPKAILEKLVKAKEAANLCSGSFAQRVTEEYMSVFDWRRNVEVFIDLYRERRDAMLAALEEYFPDGSTWSRPSGGLFIWATLPEGLNSGEMLAEAIREAKVAYVPGRAFYYGEGGESSMRLNFSYCPPETIYEGIKRLGAVIKQQLALYRSLLKGYSTDNKPAGIKAQDKKE
ncbi:MAG: PLP-dependent aminotransferase family protein [Firmicutes bacterium]|nr:PLP-dependent aminotransferase family protein [Bacillota bacterium]